MFTKLEAAIARDRDAALAGVRESAKVDPVSFVRNWGAVDVWDEYKAGRMEEEEAVAETLDRATEAIIFRAEEQIGEVRTALVRKVPKRVVCFIHESNKSAICRSYVDGEEFVGEAVGRGYNRSATSLINALNKSPSIMLILYKTIEEGAIFRSGVWIDTIPEFDAGASVGEVCGVFSVAGYKYKVLDADGDTCIIFSRKD